MKQEDALTIAGIISDIITSRRGASLFPDGKDGTPSNLGVIWIDQIGKLPDEDTEFATKAAIELFTATITVPTPSDFHSMLRKLKRDHRMKMPVLPEAEFVRDIPEWVKGKFLALSRDDYRVWPDQKPGYDALQFHNSGFRTYVWPEQEEMPDDDQDDYLAKASRMTADDFDKIFHLVIGGGS